MRTDIEKDDDAAVKARRQFLATCGKFAMVTPPVITLLLAQSKQAKADEIVAAVGSGG